MAGSTVATFAEHQLLLLTDNDYRRRKGLGPLVGAVERDAAPTTIAGEPVVEVDPALMRQLDAWKEERKAAGRRKEELTVLIEQAEAALLDQLTAASVDELVLDGRKATPQSTLWLRKRREDVTAAQVAEALRQDGLEALIQPEGYHAGTLAAWARELEAEGKPLPPHVAELLEGRETWSVRFTAVRPSRAKARRAGKRSSILDDVATGASSA